MRGIVLNPQININRKLTYHGLKTLIWVEGWIILPPTPPVGLALITQKA